LRQAARYIGGTALDRPEDIDIDPLSGHVFITLTNNSTTGNYYGSILKIEEEGGDHASTKFKPSRFLIGGEESGFACPDNMAFDQAGNLWFASDISTSYLNKPPYTKFMNNGLFVVPRQGSQAGEVIQVGSAPVGAELTGLYFSPDGDTLFMSVQHPGENSRSLAELSSNWPEGEGKIPKPAVVTVSGDMLRNLRHLG
jgi:secreted PhoX family phosphatase